jgi:hypothetical protein
VAVVALVVAALWLLDHDTRVRRDAQFDSMRRETSAEVSDLHTRAEAAMKEFRASTQVIESLEARGHALEREAATLRQKLSSLRAEENSRVRAASTPGQTETAAGIAPRLDPEEHVPGDPRLRGDDSHPGSEVSHSRSEVSHSRESGNLPDTRHLTPDTSFTSCREPSAVQDQLISNCEQRVEVARAALDAAKRSALDLQEALRAKDDIAAKLDAQHRLELKAARGARLRKFGRALQYVGVGVVIGVLVAH